MRSVVVAVGFVLVGAGVACAFFGPYAFVGRSAPKKIETVQSVATPNPKLERVNLFSEPQPDLIAQKLAVKPTQWPDVPKRTVKPKPVLPVAAVASKPAAKPKKRTATNAR